MSDQKTRVYRKRRRAEQEQATRQRIAEAAMMLHGTIGPARTTIGAIAERAGVQRGTVYRHFPDLDSLFMACSAHWVSLNPPPDPDAWRQIDDPDERLRHALSELYDWYQWAEPMLSNVIRDASLVPAIAPAARSFERGFEALHAALMAGRPRGGRTPAWVAAAIGHALDFGTWRSLTRDGGLEPREAVDLMVALVGAAGGLRRRSRASA